MIDEMAKSGEQIKVEIQTTGSRIIGTVYTLASAYHSRLSDLLNQRELTFLSVTNAAVYQRGSDELDFSTAYLAVNISNIEMIRPVD